MNSAPKEFVLGFKIVEEEGKALATTSSKKRQTANQGGQNIDPIEDEEDVFHDVISEEKHDKSKT